MIFVNDEVNELVCLLVRIWISGDSLATLEVEAQVLIICLVSVADVDEERDWFYCP